MTEGGIGGTVRVVTRRPFDSPEPYLAGSTQMVYSDLAEGIRPEVRAHRQPHVSGQQARRAGRAHV